LRFTPGAVADLSNVLKNDVILPGARIVLDDVANREPELGSPSIEAGRVLYTMPAAPTGRAVTARGGEKAGEVFAQDGDGFRYHIVDGAGTLLASADVLIVFDGAKNGPVLAADFDPVGVLCRWRYEFEFNFLGILLNAGKASLGLTRAGLDTPDPNTSLFAYSETGRGNAGGGGPVGWTQFKESFTNITAPCDGPLFKGERIGVRGVQLAVEAGVTVGGSAVAYYGPYCQPEHRRAPFLNKCFNYLSVGGSGGVGLAVVVSGFSDLNSISTSGKDGGVVQ